MSVLNYNERFSAKRQASLVAGEDTEDWWRIFSTDGSILGETSWFGFGTRAEAQEFARLQDTIQPSTEGTYRVKAADAGDAAYLDDATFDGDVGVLRETLNMYREQAREIHFSRDTEKDRSI